MEEYESSERIIYIIASSEPLAGINAYIKEKTMKYKSNRLR